MSYHTFNYGGRERIYEIFFGEEFTCDWCRYWTLTRAGTLDPNDAQHSIQCWKPHNVHVFAAWYFAEVECEGDKWMDEPEIPFNTEAEAIAAAEQTARAEADAEADAMRDIAREA